MGRTGGRCCLRKETSPALHTRRWRPDIEPLDTFYVKDGGPHQAVPRCLRRPPNGDESYECTGKLRYPRAGWGHSRHIGGLPSKNVIYSAKVASLVGRQREFGIETGPIAIDMAGVYARKLDMVDGISQVHLDKYRAASDKQHVDELMFGEGTFVAPRTVHVRLRDGGERTLTADGPCLAGNDEGDARPDEVRSRWY
jgi:hypothetical protein